MNLAIRSTPSISRRRLAEWAEERVTATSLKARAWALRPLVWVAAIRSGCTVIGVAATMRSSRPSGRYWFMRKPTVPRFMPKIGRPGWGGSWVVGVLWGGGGGWAPAAGGHDDVAVAGVDQLVAGRELGLGRARLR